MLDYLWILPRGDADYSAQHPCDGRRYAIPPYGYRRAWITALILGLAGAPAAALAADWKPDRSIEFIVPTGPGSGIDNTARTLQAILQAHKLLDAPITITNKAGGSYGVALNYLSQFPGDGHRLFIQTSTPLSALLTGQLKVNYFEFTPIANLIGTGVFQRLIKTEGWRQAVEKDQWDEDYMNSAELGRNLKKQYEILKDVLNELGMVKQ